MRRKFVFSALLGLSLGAVTVTNLSAQTSPADLLQTHQVREENAKKRIGPSGEDRETYRSFLKQPKTGIAKLVTKKPCDLPPDNRDLDKLAKQCPTHYLPGNGSHFSFRRNSYGSAQQADISMKGSVIYSMGLLAQGLMVTLGDVALDQVSLETDAVKYLAGISPATTIEAADLQSEQFNKGVRDGKYLYARGFNASTDTTYALRVVAYRAKLEKKMEVSDEQKAKIAREIRNSSSPLYRDLQIPYSDPVMISDPLFGDERKDIIVAFRIVRIDPDGSVLLLWKELKQSESPKLDGKPR